MLTLKRKRDERPDSPADGDGEVASPETAAAKRARRSSRARTPPSPAFVSRYWFAGRRARRLREALESVRSRWYGRLRGVRVTRDDEEDGAVLVVKTEDAAHAVPVVSAVWRALHADRPDEDAARRERRRRLRGPDWTIRVLVDAEAARTATERRDDDDEVAVESYKRAGRGQRLVKFQGRPKDTLRRLSALLAACEELADVPSSPSPPRSGGLITAADFGEWPVDFGEWPADHDDDEQTKTAESAVRASPPRSPVASTSWQGTAATVPWPAAVATRVVTAADYGEWPSDDE